MSHTSLSIQILFEALLFLSLGIHDRFIFIINQFKNGHRCCISCTHPGADDTGITTLTLSILGAQLIKEFGDHTL